MPARSPTVFRVEILRKGASVSWAVVATDLVDAARKARTMATQRGDVVVAVQPVGELLGEAPPAQ